MAKEVTIPVTGFRPKKAIIDIVVRDKASVTHYYRLEGQVLVVIGGIEYAFPGTILDLVALLS